MEEIRSRSLVFQHKVSSLVDYYFFSRFLGKISWYFALYLRLVVSTVC